LRTAVAVHCPPRADIEARAKAAELDATSGWLDGLQREFARICGTGRWAEPR
jgi:hypothetical protein